ncbi:MAG TPA: class I SAM-dependent methyltransferase [Usitatibacter sp.]|nr:class I SAM-dependent methyltransferase [Usitatibacter sp.]
MIANRSIEFFDAQFRRQAQRGELALNPFERAALPYLCGRVLDMGCGLGNLALAAAARGCDVLALDASPAGIESLSERARVAGLPVRADIVDARTFETSLRFDAVISIGLLMFFDCDTARRLMRRWQSWVKPGGAMAVNVLVEGTTFLDMFDPAGHCLWKPEDLEAAFSGWELACVADDEFPAPHGSVKRFRTLIARKRGTPFSPIMAP